MNEQNQETPPYLILGIVVFFVVVIVALVYYYEVYKPSQLNNKSVISTSSPVLSLEGQEMAIVTKSSQIKIPAVTTSKDITITDLPANIAGLLPKNAVIISIKSQVFSDRSRGFKVVFQVKSKLMDIFNSTSGMIQKKPYEPYTGSAAGSAGMLEGQDSNYHYNIIFKSLDTATTLINLTAIKYTID